MYASLQNWVRMMFHNTVAVADAVGGCRPRNCSAAEGCTVKFGKNHVHTITHLWMYAGLRTWFRMMFRNTVAVADAMAMSDADANQEIVPMPKVVQCNSCTHNNSFVDVCRPVKLGQDNVPQHSGGGRCHGHVRCRCRSRNCSAAEGCTVNVGQCVVHTITHL